MRSGSEEGEVEEGAIHTGNQARAARLVASGQSQAAVARCLGVVEQTLGNWGREPRAGTLKGAAGKPQVTVEQVEISRLRAELARVTMERHKLVWPIRVQCRVPLANVSGYHEHLARNCWDNACSESLFSSLKVERLHGEQFETIRQAKDETINWLLWYN